MSTIDYTQFLNATTSHFNDVEFMLKALDTVDTQFVFSKAGNDCRRNHEFLLKALTKDPSIYNKLDEAIKSDTDFLTKIVVVNNKLIKYIPDNLLTKELVLEFVQASLNNVLYLPPVYRTDKDIFLYYLRKYHTTYYGMFDYCACFKVDVLLKDRDTALECLRAGNRGLALIKTSDYQKDIQFIYEAAWRYSKTEFELLDVPLNRHIKFLQRHARFINNDNWPMIWEAIQYNPKDFFNPPSLFKTLTDRKIDLVLLASWALKNKHEPLAIDPDLQSLEFYTDL